MIATIERRGEILIAMANGRVDSANAAAFQEELANATNGNDHSMILDLGGLSYISSAGLRVILLLAKDLRTKEAKFAVCSPSDQIREIFEISGFSQIVPLHVTQDDAFAAFDGGPEM